MIGSPIVRTDGPLKVTGRAPYALERRDMGPVLHASIREAAISMGRVARIDTAAAAAAPGVRLVWTHQNAPRQTPAPPDADMFDPHPELNSDRIDFHGTAIGLVVAETPEQARAAADLIEVEYEVEPGTYDLAIGAAGATQHDESRFGDVDAAIASSAGAIDEAYSTPYHFSQPIELNAATAIWRGDHLTLYIAAQMLQQLRDGVAKTLGINRANITIDSAYVGGGFGSKIALHCEAILSALAARELGQPVQVALTRRQVFTLIGQRPASVNRIRLAADADGRLTAIAHDATTQRSPNEAWNESVAGVVRPLYAAPNRLTRNSEAILNVRNAEPVRSPGEMPGLLVVESALDELAEKLGIDPVEMRIRNDTAIDPEKNRPFNDRLLSECLREGAERFGWADRPKVAGSRRDGKWLVGYGVASSIRAHFQGATEVKVRLEPDGRAVVLTDMTDIGTGTYTILAQVAAQALGIPVSQVTVQLGNTDNPASQGSGGSWGAGNASVATDRACAALRDQIAAVAGTTYNDIFAEVRRHFPSGITASGKTLRSREDPNYQNYSQFSYGAAFCEVGVDAYTGEARVRRMLGVFAAGRILNPRTARSQLLGGMIWGISAALHEGGVIDPTYGTWVNGDLAEYLVPVHADVPDIEAIMLDDFDDKANHLGVKGIGELGACGTGAAVANAVYNATGVRVRDFPITLDKLLPGLPDLATLG